VFGIAPKSLLEISGICGKASKLTLGAITVAYNLLNERSDLSESVYYKETY